MLGASIAAKLTDEGASAGEEAMVSARLSVLEVACPVMYI